MTLAQAQEAKLDHVCRKLMLQRGERFLDIGAGWGGLLLWAAEHYGVRGHGITLVARTSTRYVNRVIDERGLGGRVSMALADYRELREAEPYDKIASIGMFEHVGLAQLPAYFAKIYRLLRPGGLLMNHGITAGGTRNDQLGAGMGDFIERYIFPGGELVHVSHVHEGAVRGAASSRSTSRTCGRTTGAPCGPGRTRSRRSSAQARELTREAVVRAYRLYLAGSAMCFEQGWIALHQMLAAKPDRARSTGGADARGTIGLPLQPRLHLSLRDHDLQVQIARPRAT